MATPSLLIIPDRYKAAKLYSQLPESGDGDFTVVRGTTATRVNASGLIESVASGVPRIDYTGGGCGKLLVEPAATNLLTRSEELDNAAWGGGSTLLVNANVATSPDGTINADRLIGDGTSGVKNNNAPSVSVVSGLVYTLSCFAKQDSTSLVQVWFSLSTFGANQNEFKYANFDLQTGLVSFQSAALVSARIEDYGEGWYRCVITGTATATATSVAGGVALTDLTTNRLPSFTTANGLFAWGAQLELGSVATSYIPTVAATVTRNADNISLSSVSGLLNSAQGTLYLEVERLGASGAGLENVLFVSDTSLNNFVNIVFVPGTSRYRAQVRESGVTTGVANATAGYSGNIKIAAAYAANDLVLYINGVQQQIDSSVTVPTVAFDSVALGSFFDGTFGDRFTGNYKATAIYTTRLSNDELASLTTL